MIDKVLPDSVEPEYLEGSSTLVNLLGIKETAALNIKEADITFIRSLELFSSPKIVTPYSFDFAHLKAIHSHLFSDIFQWAGCPRSFDMAKSGNVFTPAKELAKFEPAVFAGAVELFELSKRNEQPSKVEIVKGLSKALGLINQFHPFPEGNGRSQRVFIFSLAKELGYSIDWSNVVNWEMIEVCKRVHEGNYEPMENLIDRILRLDT